MTREQLRTWAAKAVVKWPPPTPEQRDRLAVLLAPARVKTAPQRSRKAA